MHYENWIGSVPIMMQLLKPRSIYRILLNRCFGFSKSTSPQRHRSWEQMFSCLKLSNYVRQKCIVNYQIYFSVFPFVVGTILINPWVYCDIMKWYNQRKWEKETFCSIWHKKELYDLIFSPSVWLNWSLFSCT